MALSFLLVMAATVILIRPETPVTKVRTMAVIHPQTQIRFSQDAWSYLSVITTPSTGPTPELT